MKEKFIEKSFRPQTAEVIEKADEIIRAYQEMGFTLTLRQLYYQFVARDLIPNKQKEYKRLGSIVNDARLAGLLDWDAIEDRTRNVRKPATWESPQTILDAVADQYQQNPWRDQDFAPEVWIEKDALLGVIEPICKRMRVPYFACRGYASQSEAYSAGKRFALARRRGKTPVVFHLGDHDPSGLDMTRDNSDRLAMFARFDVEVRRLALNMNQIEQYSPPPNPAKETDARFLSYSEEFGDESWELDALDPPVIEALIDSALKQIIDQDDWDASIDREEESKGNLAIVAARWDEVVEWLGGQLMQSALDLGDTSPVTIMVWDCETTGTQEDKAAEIIELGRVILEPAAGTISDLWTALAKPSGAIPPETKAVHHITERDVEASPPVGNLWRPFFAPLGEVGILAAHNAEFERHFHNGNGRDWICTYKSSLVVWPDAPSHGNQALRYWLDIDAEPDFRPELAMPPHRALPDAYTTAFILRRLLREKTVEELITITKYPALLRKMNFGKHKGMTFEEAPADYLEWIVDKSEMGPDVKFSAKYWLKKRGYRR